jgi:hypothetical protein
MGLLDKAKAQMQQATTMAKDAAQKGQAKLATMQSKKHSDALLRDLGAIVYGQQTGRPSPTAAEDTQRILEALQTHEGQTGQIDLTLEAPRTAGGAAMVSSGVPTNVSSGVPTNVSSGVPASAPPASAPVSSMPAAVPTAAPSAAPTGIPSGVPSSVPTASAPEEEEPSGPPPSQTLPS